MSPSGLSHRSSRLLLWALSCGVVASPSNTILLSQSAGAEVRTERRKPFDPARQPVLRATAVGVEVALLGSEPCPGCRSAYKLNFEIRRNGSRRRIALTDGPAQVDQITMVGTSTAAIVGQYQSNVDMVALLDTSSGSVVDKWLCFDPAVSPDGAAVVYQKVHPVHFTEGVSSVYVVYQTTLSPSQNRGTGIPLSDIVNVGATLYPPGTTNVPGSNVRVPEVMRHQLASSQFFWGPGLKVAFADRAEGRMSIVVADLGEGVDRAVVRTVPLEPARILASTGCREFRDQGREEYALSVSAIEFLGGVPDRVRVHFTYSLPDCRGPQMLDLEVR